MLSLSSSILPLAFASLAVASQKCKCLSGDPCFPSQQEWDAFATSLSQPLISNQRPLASVCYNSSSNFDPLACAQVTANQFNSFFRVESSNTVQFVDFEDLITNNSVQQCPFNPTSGDICQQGRVPSYSIDVRAVSDIQNTFNFVSKHNLHLVVRNTGHELMGRSFGVGSVELFMHNLQGANFSDNFIPEGAPESRSGQHAVTIQPGIEWAQLYLLADQHNRSVAGGFSVNGTVGAGGGWPLGGGHSILSPFVGLGVDNILQYTVVLPNASHVTANNYQNTDLFWALRGGGGPSFGVLTSATYKTHPNLPYTGAFYIATANSSESYHQLFETWFQFHNAISDAGWGGTWPFVNNALFLTLVTQGTPPISPTANSTLEAFFAASGAIPGVNVSQAISIPYNSFQSFFFDNLVDTSRGFGFNLSAAPQAGIRTATSSWLLPRELTGGYASALADIFVNIPVGTPFMVGGKGVSDVDPDATAVTPAWRTVISDMIVNDIFNETSSPAEILAVRQNVHDQIQPFRDLAPVPTGGQYLNEADILETNFQGAYWGRHYPRLLAIKKEIDPNDLLIVQKGVNSEQWDDEVVCKTI